MSRDSCQSVWLLVTRVPGKSAEAAVSGCVGGSDGDLLARLGDVGVPVQPAFQFALQHLHLFQFAVDQIQLRVMIEVTDPVDQLRLPGMGGEAAQGVDLGLDRDALVQHAYRRRAVDYVAAKSAGRLETGEHQVTFAAPEVVLEVVDDAPAGAHAAAGNDDGAALDPVDRHGIFRRRGDAQGRQPFAQVAIAVLLDQGAVVLVELVVEARVDLVGADGHGAVEKHRLLRQAPLVVEAAKVIQQVLGAAHGEGRNQHIAAIAVGLLENPGQLVDGFLAAAVVTVAVGRLHQYYVGAVEEGRVLHQRRTGVAQIAGEHQTPGQVVVVNFQFHYGRAENMPGIVEGQADARRHFMGLAVGQRLASLEGALGVHRVVQRFDFRLAQARPPLVFPLGVVLLDVRRIQQHQLDQLAGGLGGKDRPAKTRGDQARQEPGVIQVGMGQDHRMDRCGIERERLFVGLFLLAAPLAHAAFEQHAAALAGFEQVARTGDLLDGAEEREQGHVRSPRAKEADQLIVQAWQQNGLFTLMQVRMKNRPCT